jgi:hypothetical protein
MPLSGSNRGYKDLLPWYYRRRRIEPVKWVGVKGGVSRVYNMGRLREDMGAICLESGEKD